MSGVVIRATACPMTDDSKLSFKEAQQAFVELVEIVHRLRAPGGCPWDREQTAKSLKPYIVEEAYEVLDAIDSGCEGDICEELGDLLLQVVLQAEIAAEQKSFTIKDVMNGIARKLVNRHPHVFGETRVGSAKEVIVNWERIKNKEKAGKGLFDGLPKQLPALQKAARMGEKAARIGFDWSNSTAVRDKVEEELRELDEAIIGGKKQEIKHELGDLLFAIAQWARHLGEQPEELLRDCCTRFQDRFGKMEQLIIDSGQSPGELDIEILEEFWTKVKEM